MFFMRSLFSAGTVCLRSRKSASSAVLLLRPALPSLPRANDIDSLSSAILLIDLLTLFSLLLASVLQLLMFLSNLEATFLDLCVIRSVIDSVRSLDVIPIDLNSSLKVQNESKLFHEKFSNVRLTLER